MNLESVLLSVMLMAILMTNLTAYRIFKEEKGVDRLFESAIKINNFEILIFLFKALFGRVSVKNKLAIWTCWFYYLIFWCLLITVLVLRLNH